MNAPERITSLQVAPGVLLLRPDMAVDLDLRRKAIASILRQVRGAKPLPPGESGRDIWRGFAPGMVAKRFILDASMALNGFCLKLDRSVLMPPQCWRR